ncbi:hypothetical protein C5Y93_05035 [Blastopirellula marina]|uniref:Uncharacterized protein n=1 Tax=Blastopirellula marina TaxID=124 RepID=A0A2S8GSR2_9BACT|nr:hypothetical protein C5Y93_05035 [Blastopirellula marina]
MPSYTLPVDSVLVGQEDCRFPVTVHCKTGNKCELCDASDETLFGDEDSNSPMFCAKCYFDTVNNPDDGQSRLVAKSPELLEASESLCSFLRSNDIGLPENDEGEAALSALESAVEKAHGKYFASTPLK